MRAFRELDKVLRGEARSGDPGVVTPLWPLLRVKSLLASTYGVCMGVYGLLGPEGTEWRQTVAGAVKVPSLFLLTLSVTFPSLYVFNTLLSPRLRLGVTALSVLTAVLSEFWPITALQRHDGQLPVRRAAECGGVHARRGVRPWHLAELTHRVDAAGGGGDRFVVLEAAPSHGKYGVIYAWMFVFALVGGQMSWILRPFSRHRLGGPRRYGHFEPMTQSVFQPRK